LGAAFVSWGVGICGWQKRRPCNLAGDIGRVARIPSASFGKFLRGFRKFAEVFPRLPEGARLWPKVLRREEAGKRSGQCGEAFGTTHVGVHRIFFIDEENTFPDAHFDSLTNVDGGQRLPSVGPPREGGKTPAKTARGRWICTSEFAHAAPTTSQSCTLNECGDGFSVSSGPGKVPALGACVRAVLLFLWVSLASKKIVCVSCGQGRGRRDGEPRPPPPGGMPLPRTCPLPARRDFGVTGLPH